MSDPTSTEVYEAWLDRYDAAYRDPDVLGSSPCASCASVALHLAFVRPDPDLASATAVFWCSSCHRGLVPNRAPLREQHRRLVVDADAIPDFDIVRPGASGR